MNPIIPPSYEPLNPGGAELCAEKLRTFSGFENCLEQEATAIVENIRALAGILVRNVNKSFLSKQDKAIGLEPSLQIRKAA